jgi:allantoin racemase
MRKIAFLMPTASTGKLSGILDEREKILKTIANTDTHIEIFGLEDNPKNSHLGTIQSAFDASLSVPEDIECAIEAEKAGYQAVIIPCGGDPGIAPLREVLNIPVIPPGASAKHICSLTGPRFSVLSSGKGPCLRKEFHEREGLMKHVSTHPIGLSVPEIREKKEEALEAMISEGKRAVKDYGAASVTYGCMSMGFLMVDEELGKAIGVPAVNPVKVAVKLAEGYIDLGITHSKYIYPEPPSYRRNLKLVK